MKPYRNTDTTDVGALISQMSVRKIIPTRFNIEMPPRKLANALFAAYEVEVRMRRRKLIVDEETRSHIIEAAKWLGDPGGKMGLMMMGSCGNGKTTLMLAICTLVKHLFDSAYLEECISFRVVNAKEIARMAVDKDRRRQYEALFREELLAIDELGEEAAQITHYGVVHTPLRDLLEERYARQKMTIVTTNLRQAPERNLFEIRDHYGERVVDRLREMMQIIPFRNDSYREASEAKMGDIA